MRVLWRCAVLAVVAVGCGTPVEVPPAPDSGSMNDGGAGRDGGADAGPGDAGSTDAGSNDAGASDAGTGDGGTLDVGDAGAVWTFVPIAGSKCARGAQTGFGYSAGATDTLVIFLQGGGACWNTGTCHPSLQQWGPVCNYGSNSVCLWDNPGGTQPLAAFVAHPDPFPADGGGAFPSELAQVKSSLLFARRAENPLSAASYVFVPYCTGDLHAGDATRTYLVKADLVSNPAPVTHAFNGARNMDLFLADLRARHPTVNTIYLMGASGGGYGASLNLHRVRAAFPEAVVHLLADSAPMLDSPHWNDWASEWNIQLPPGCAGCDAGLSNVLEREIDLATGARVGLLAFQEDGVITRFFFSGGDTNSWLNPPFATYSASLNAELLRYDARPAARYFVVTGQEHVMLGGYGVVLSDGGISPARRSNDGGTDLRTWLNAWIDGGTWPSVH
ncbi:MAG: pectin acetylesterase-family hydrolase [Myxococcaceae bacterium]